MSETHPPPPLTYGLKKDAVTKVSWNFLKHWYEELSCPLMQSDAGLPLLPPAS
jgi:hypothetical protein